MIDGTSTSPETKTAGGANECRPKREESLRFLYKSPTWKAIRRHRLHDEPHCRECAKEGHRIAATHVTHQEPHHGQWSLFMKYENTESVCERHYKARRLQKNDAAD
jgi:5-methylcytosine-specific restriction protein A